MAAEPIEDLYRHGRSRELIVVLHAFRQTPARMAAVRSELCKLRPDADHFVPQMPTGMFSRADPEEIAQHLCERIEKICAATPYHHVTFVGHSIGGLIARMIYVLAREHDLARNIDNGWSTKVTRVVLLAGMNRGWQVGHHLSMPNAVIWTIGTVLAKGLHLIGGRETLIMRIRRGACFVTNLRVRWIALRNRSSDAMPVVVQLLGSIDDMVAPDDNIDLVAGSHFIYMDMPYTGHGTPIDLYEPRRVPGPEGASVTVGSLRRAAFKDALDKKEKLLADEHAMPSDEGRVIIEPEVEKVVFVVHGIRDKGYWTQKIARRVLALEKQRAENTQDTARIMRSETSSYGFFPMLPFLLPGARQKKVAWFMDQYAETKARYPNAEMSFVGHSNGTYLLGRALELYPYIRFENVVLAGSVIRSDYPWRDKIDSQDERKMVGRVLNFVASGDWVVAFFPKAIELLRLQDLGSGGHDGFDELARNLRYVEGAHSAALREENWDSIAGFVLGEELTEVPEAVEAEGPNWGVKAIGSVAPFVWVVLGLIVFGIGTLIWNSFDSDALRTLALVIYALALWKAITKL